MADNGINVYSLRGAGFKVLGGGENPEYFDKADIVTDKKGNIVYWPGKDGAFQDCFPEVEATLEKVIYGRGGEFTCHGRKFVFEDGVIKQTAGEPQNQLEVYQAAKANALKIEDKWIRLLEIIKIAKAMYEAGLKTEAIAVFGEASALVEEGSRANKSESYLRIGKALAELGLKDLAKAEFTKALNALSELAGNPSLLDISMCGMIREIPRAKFEIAIAKAFLDSLSQKAEDIAKTGSEPKVKIGPFVCLGLSYSDLGFKTESLAAFKRADELTKVAHNGDLKELLWRRTHIASLLGKNGFVQESAAIFREVIGILKKDVKDESDFSELLDKFSGSVVRANLGKETITLYQELVSLTKTLKTDCVRARTLTLMGYSLKFFLERMEMDQTAENKLFDILLAEVGMIKTKDLSAGAIRDITSTRDEYFRDKQTRRKREVEED